MYPISTKEWWSFSPPKRGWRSTEEVGIYIRKRLVFASFDAKQYIPTQITHTELQNKLLTPTVNGLVVPAVALLFATLTSTTITTLRQRQVEIRRAINMEAGELRAIECLLDSIVHGPVQDQCREYVSGNRPNNPWTHTTGIDSNSLLISLENS
jgi:Protein of unknown function (DUF4239)